MNKYEMYFNAIEKYNSNPFYRRFALLVSTTICLFQLISVLMIDGQNISWEFTIYFFIAYAITDFINGIVHMYMDNNTSYTSIFGPFIAAFHLHHAKPTYEDKPVLFVYFSESGTKYWLLIYLILIVFLKANYNIPPSAYFTLVCVGVLSSCAEVSHYLCHNSKNRFIHFLQKYNLILSPKHHARHHSHDNVNYAFLNGISDPLLNVIAKKSYLGYKNNADKHVKAYRRLKSN